MSALIKVLKSPKMLFRGALMAGAAALMLACSSSASHNMGPYGNDGSPVPRKTASIGEVCGGMIGIVCADPALFCKTSEAARCGAADQMGVCSPRPQMCTMEYDPVCGCDGRTYSNACAAHGNGVSVASRGTCG